MSDNPMGGGFVDLSGPWCLHPRVSLRPEPFGALAYHYDNRRLNFLRSPELVALVRDLEHHPDPRAAFDAQGIADARWPSFSKALASLARSDFIQPSDRADGMHRGDRMDRNSQGCPAGPDEREPVEPS